MPPARLLYPSHCATAVLPEKGKFGIIKSDRQFSPSVLTLRLLSPRCSCLTFAIVFSDYLAVCPFGGNTRKDSSFETRTDSSGGRVRCPAQMVRQSQVGVSAWLEMCK